MLVVSGESSGILVQEAGNVTFPSVQTIHTGFIFLGSNV